MQRRLILCYTDTGGTFTDTFMIDEGGEFVIGKAPTTPEDISKGYFNSILDAARKRGIVLEELFPQLEVVGFGSTIVVNALINREGVSTGLILTKGFEHLMLIERGKQTWVEYHKPDRAHFRVHRHTVPIVPYSLTRGVTERIDCLGEEIIPLYEHEVCQAARELIEKGVEAIAICFLFSWMNREHEERAREIVQEVAKKLGKEMPVYLSVDISPVLRELSRANAVVIEARTLPLVSESFVKIDRQLKEYGFNHSFQVMQSSGGLASFDAAKAVDIIESGPVGGLIGGVFIADTYGFDNIITTDVGGTSFDVGIIKKGMFSIEREPVVQNMILGVPKASVLSIGAGGGTLVRIDPISKRVTVGPDSAGATPGPICYDQGGETPTVTDVDLLLGYINPDYFLGGRIKLNRDKAYQVFKEKVAVPLGIGVDEAAYGVRKIIDTRMKDTISGMITAIGGNTQDFHLLSFGSAGPGHVEGYTEELGFKGVMCFPYSAAFSAFGASTANYEHHYTMATNIVVPPFADDETKMSVGRRLNELWRNLEEKAYDQMQSEGFSRDKVKLIQLAMIRYGRQLDDLIVTSPISRVDSAQNWDSLIGAFENMYEKIYTKSAKYPQAGYDIFEVGLIAGVDKLKPTLRKHPLVSKKPPEGARKGERDCLFYGEWYKTGIFNWDALKAGNTIPGPAIFESPTTTLLLPLRRSAYIDEYMTVWLKE